MFFRSEGSYCQPVGMASKRSQGTGYFSTGLLTMSRFILLPGLFFCPEDNHGFIRIKPHCLSAESEYTDTNTELRYKSASAAAPLSFLFYVNSLNFSGDAAGLDCKYGVDDCIRTERPRSRPTNMSVKFSHKPRKK